MISYFRNWYLWARGWTLLGPGFPYPYGYHNSLRWWLVYLLDYGLAVLLGRGVQTLSKAFSIPVHSEPEKLGPLLFGSVDLWRPRSPGGG